MNIDAMTLQELRDWHYRRKVLSDFGKPLSEMPWAEQHWDDKHCRVVDERLNNHPFPPTLDGAASAMPEGWEWRKRTKYATIDNETDRVPIVEWLAFKPGMGISVDTPDTGNEKYDRYLLAQRAWNKEVGE